METHEIPRDLSGEGRILFIFTTKSFIYTMVCGIIGAIIYLILKSFGLSMAGLIVILVFALIGYVIGMLKIPNIPTMPWTHNISGQGIDDILLRLIKFKKKKNRIYVYTKPKE